MNLTDNKNGKYLYRYTPVNLNSLKILIDNEFYLSPPDILNDPFEGDFKISNLPELYNESTFKTSFETREKEEIERLDKNTKSGLLDKRRYEKKEKEKEKENKREFLLYLEEHLSNTIKRRFGTTSFSKDCKSILMWSHYADSHKGFVIVFNRESLSLQYGIKDHIFDVEYKGLPEISVDAKDLLIIENKEALFKNKLRSWIKEKEVRIIKEHWSEDGFKYDFLRLLKFPPESIVGIIYGSKMSVENIMTIENLLDGESLSHIKTYHTNKNENKDRLVFSEMTYRIKKNSSN